MIYKRIIFISTLAACSALSSVCEAGKLSTEISHIQSAETRKTSDAILASVEKIAGRLAEFYKLNEERISTISDMSDYADEIQDGINVYNGSPLKLNEMLDTIENETSQIKSRDVVTPSFENLMTPEIRKNLSSLQAKDRRLALVHLELNGKKARANYIEKMQKAKLSRKEAQGMYDKAGDAWERGRKLEKTLGKINDSPAGIFLNAANREFAYRFLDLVIYINPALARKSHAAQDLLKRHDAGLKSMEDQLTRYDHFISWVQYQGWEESARLAANSPQERLGQSLKDAQDIVDNIVGVGSGSPPPVSAENAGLSQLILSTVHSNAISTEKARQLVEEAARKRAAKARYETMTSILSLANSIISRAAGMTGGQPASGGTTNSVTLTPEEQKIIRDYEHIRDHDPVILRPGPVEQPPLKTPPMINWPTPDPLPVGRAG